MATAVTTLREINQFATIRQICNQFGIEREELEQSIIEDAFSVYAFLSLSDGTTTVEYDEDGNECKPQAGNLGFMPSDHYLLSREAAAAIVRDGSLTSNMVFEDFHLKKEFTVKKEYLRIKKKDIEDLLNPPAPADKSYEMDAGELLDLVDSDNPYLSQKLEAANKTLLYLQKHGTIEKHIRPAAEAFISKYFPELNKPTPLNEIIKVLNWDHSGRKAYPPKNEFLKKASRNRENESQ